MSAAGQPRTVLRIALALAGCTLLVLAVTRWVAIPWRVLGPSMTPTLGHGDLVVIDLASTPAIAQASARAETLWQALFPTIMMGDDRAIRSVWIAGKPRR